MMVFELNSKQDWKTYMENIIVPYIQRNIFGFKYAEDLLLYIDFIPRSAKYIITNNGLIQIKRSIDSA